MLEFNYVTKPQVPRHIQDEFTTHCGRACAQMVISALTLTPAHGDNPLVPVTQNELFLREHDHSPENSANAENVWYTHPDEMYALLKDSVELKNAKLDDWRLAVYPRQKYYLGAKQLLADVVLTLQTEAKPAAITWNDADHWVLVVGAHLNPSEGLMFEVLDPLDSVNAPKCHRYLDECSQNQNGQTYLLAEPCEGPFLVERSLDVKRRDIPKGLNDYAKNCVGVLYGKAPDVKDLDAFAKEIFRGRSKRRPYEDRMDELLYVADTWHIESLHEFLHNRAEVVGARTVTALGSEAPAYSLVSMQSETRLGAWRGLLAVFSIPSGALTQFRFTGDHRAVESLLASGGSTLLFSERQPEIFGSPYFPFLRANDRFIRLFDGRPVNLPV